jgi:hypothetical protein
MGCTVTAVDPVMPVKAASTVVDPTRRAVIAPVLLTLTIPALLVFQVAESVRSCVLPSVNDPIAVSCRLAVSGMVGFAGEILIELRAGGETSRDALPLMPPVVAVTTVVPNPFASATPVLLTLTTRLEALVQETDFVRSRTLPSVYMPCAVSCAVAPSGIVERLATTEMEASVAAWIVSSQEPLTAPEVAVIEAFPIDLEPANPLELTIATLGSELFQVTEFVTSCVLRSV